MPITFTNCSKCLNCPYIFMIDELENNLCITCSEFFYKVKTFDYVKKCSFMKNIQDKEKKILDNWIESVII